MMAWVTVVSALALVLGVVAIAAHFARRFGVRTGMPDSVGSIEVLSRVALAPKQGVATLKVGGRLLLVSYGEGGIRTLGEVDAVDPETSEVDDDVDVVMGGPGRVRGESDVLPGGVGSLIALARRRIAGVLTVILTVGMVLGPAAALHAQVAPEAPVADVEGVAQVPGAPAGPHMSVSLGGQDEEERLELSGPVGTVLFIGFLTLIPTLLLLMTSFTRILIVLHLLKQALGTQTAPPAHLLAAMALLLTGFVMAPTFEQIQVSAVDPWMNGETDELQMLQTASVPMREFMLANTREQDLASFTEMSTGPMPETIDDVPLVVVTSAFVTSELTSAFQMGFALFLPFVVIDIVVASVLMSMGMFMLPPVMVSLPFKLLLFVLVDGWSLILNSLVRSF